MPIVEASLTQRNLPKGNGMTRKDFELIASSIHSTKLDSREILGSASVLRLLSERLADGLASDNARFDQERFLTACGFGVSP